jgi:mRNA interferase MazF
VIQSNSGSKYSPTIVAAPLTSSTNKLKKHLEKPLPMHVFLDAKKYGLKRDSIVLCEQAKPISKNYIGEKLTEQSLPIEVMKEIAIAHAINVPLIGFLDIESLEKLVLSLRSSNNICVGCA